MKNEMVPEEMMLRNPLCVRWNDADYKLVIDTAWERRMRVSELVREIVLERLQEGKGENGVPADSCGKAGESN